MPALLARCDEGPAAVPSDVVQCDRCGADCWLSRKSGSATLALAAAQGDGRKLCEPCLMQLVDERFR